MQNNRAVRKWADMYKLNVAVSGAGKTVGQIGDFYFKPTNALAAFLVNTRLHGNLALPLYGIEAVESGQITIRNEEVLLRAIPPYPLGQSLFSCKVVNTNREVLGVVKDVTLVVDPPRTMRIETFTVARTTNDSGRAKIFTADGVDRYEDDMIIVYDHVARALSKLS